MVLEAQEVVTGAVAGLAETGAVLAGGAAGSVIGEAVTVTVTTAVGDSGAGHAGSGDEVWDLIVLVNCVGL